MTAIDDLDVFTHDAFDPVLGGAVVPVVDVAALLAGSVSANTARNYRQDWTRFTTWCTTTATSRCRRRPPRLRTTSSPRRRSAPTRASGRYAVATLTRWVAAIASSTAPGPRHPEPGRRRLWGGGEGRGRSPDRSGNPAAPSWSAPPWRRCAATTPATATAPPGGSRRCCSTTSPASSPRPAVMPAPGRCGCGNAATAPLLLLAFAGAFRRSELATLQFGDITVKLGIGHAEPRHS